MMSPKRIGMNQNSRACMFIHIVPSLKYDLLPLALLTPSTKGGSERPRIPTILLSSSEGHNQICRIAKKKADQQTPHDDFGHFEPLGNPEEFGHNVDDRASGKSEKQ